MLIGTQSRFAVEYEIVSRSGAFVYVRFRFWIGGYAVGDWDETCTLGVLVHSAIVFLQFAGDRSLVASCGTSSKEMWDYVKQVCSSDNPVLLQLSIEGRFRQRYFLHELSDDSVGQRFQVMLFNIDGVERILWQPRADESKLHEVNVAVGTVDNVVNNFVMQCRKMPT